MTKKPFLERIFPFSCFILSGFSALLDQIVWLRLAFSKFGIITPVVSVVIAIFMAGLALGSVYAGRNIERFCNSKNTNPLSVYAIIEFLIGCGAILVPIMFSSLSRVLLRAGEMNSITYLATSGAMISISILPWCILMGMTFPVMTAYIKRKHPDNHSSFSNLYLANVLGAILGIVLTAGVLIELLGFHRTLLVSALSNYTIATMCLIMLRRESRNIVNNSIIAENSKYTSSVIGFSSGWILFITGLCSMGMEVAWTRAFTPITKTSIYAFAFLLAVYMASTAVGSFTYRVLIKSRNNLSIDSLLPWMATAAFLPLILNDPMFNPGLFNILTSLIPMCGIMGFLTPAIIDEASQGIPNKVGKAYAINVIGCIIGPLITGYLLLPLAGLKWTLITLCLPLCWIAFLKTDSNHNNIKRSVGLVFMISTAIIALFFNTYEDKARKEGCLVNRDFTATVIASGQGMNKQLLVNGYGMTVLTPVTKFMAHFPLCILETPPKSALAICFGMGTTFRSLASWGIETTAVELVPGVKQSFPYFHANAGEIVKLPNVQIIVDDGRRFLDRTSKKYDLIVVDPPPPVEAAGSSLLYSKEFCRVMNKHLTSDGVLMHWYPGGELATLLAIAQSICAEFPHVRIFRSVEGWGYHIFAANHPIDLLPSPEVMESRMPRSAKDDFMEWYPGHTPKEIFKIVQDNEIPVSSILEMARKSGVPMISDDVPYNEYFALRRYVFPTSEITKDVR